MKKLTATYIWYDDGDVLYTTSFVDVELRYTDWPLFIGSLPRRLDGKIDNEKFPPLTTRIGVHDILVEPQRIYTNPFGPNHSIIAVCNATSDDGTPRHNRTELVGLTDDDYKISFSYDVFLHAVQERVDGPQVMRNEVIVATDDIYDSISSLIPNLQLRMSQMQYDNISTLSFQTDVVSPIIAADDAVVVLYIVRKIATKHGVIAHMYESRTGQTSKIYDIYAYARRIMKANEGGE